MYDRVREEDQEMKIIPAEISSGGKKAGEAANEDCERDHGQEEVKGWSDQWKYSREPCQDRVEPFQGMHFQMKYQFVEKLRVR